MVIRKGSTRTVLVHGGYAIKLGFDARGRHCNRYEADLYRRENDRRRAMLCPVLFCDPTGTVLVMPEARPLTEQEYDHQREIINGFPAA
jgi:hypothetical protein